MKLATLKRNSLTEIDRLEQEIYKWESAIAEWQIDEVIDGMVKYALIEGTELRLEELREDLAIEKATYKALQITHIKLLTQKPNKNYRKLEKKLEELTLN